MATTDFDALSDQLEATLDKSLRDLKTAAEPLTRQLQDTATKVKADFLRAEHTASQHLKELGKVAKSIDQNKLKKALNIDLTPVKKFLKSRREETESAANLISAFTHSQGEFLKDKFAKLIFDDTDVKTTQEIKTLVKEVDKLVVGMAQSLPEELTAAFGSAESELFSNFRLQAMQVLSSPDVAANIASFKSMAKDTLVNMAEDLKSTVQEVSTEALDALGTLQNTVTNNPGLVANFKDRITSELPGMTTTIAGAQQKVAQLQALINSGGQFSPQRIQSIISDLQSVTAPISAANSSIASLHADSIMDLVSKASSMSSKMGDIVNMTQNFGNFRQNMLADINPGKIFNTVFSSVQDSLASVTNSLQSAQSMFPAAKGPNDILGPLTKVVGSVPGLLDTPVARAMQSLNTVMGKVNAAKGLFSLFKKKQFTTDLSNMANSSVQQMESVAKDALAHVLPTAQIKKMENDVRAVVSSARKLLSGGLPKPEVLSAIGARLQSGAADIVNNLTSFQTTLNKFVPEITSDAKAFFQSIGSIAPAAAQALASSDIKAFEKCFSSPQYITMAGQAAGMLQEVLGQVESMAIEDASRISEMVSFVSGFHQKTTMAAWLDNPSMQKSRALKEIGNYVTSVIEPAERLVNMIEGIKWA